MYRINPFAPVDDIVEALMERRERHQAQVDLGMSFAMAVRENNSESLMRLALAHYVWRNDRLDAKTMAEMVAVMNWQGAKKSANRSRN